MDPATDDQKGTKIVPSMLHHIDRSDLLKYSLEEVFTAMAQEEARENTVIKAGASIKPERVKFSKQLSKASKFRSQLEVIQAAKAAFQS